MKVKLTILGITAALVLSFIGLSELNKPELKGRRVSLDQIPGRIIAGMEEE